MLLTTPGPSADTDELMVNAADSHQGAIEILLLPSAQLLSFHIRILSLTDIYYNYIKECGLKIVDIVQFKPAHAGCEVQKDAREGM